MDLEDSGRPFAPDTEPAGDSDVSVDDEELAVIAWHKAEPSAKTGRAEDGDVDFGLSQTTKKFFRRTACSDPVDEEADGHAASVTKLSLLS